MQSPSVQELRHSHTPESNPSPIVKVSQLNPPVDVGRGTGWFLKYEEDEPAGYVFYSEVFREGSD